MVALRHTFISILIGPSQGSSICLVRNHQPSCRSSCAFFLTCGYYSTRCAALPESMASGLPRFSSRFLLAILASSLVRYLAYLPKSVTQPLHQDLARHLVLLPPVPYNYSRLNLHDFKSDGPILINQDLCPSGFCKPNSKELLLMFIPGTCCKFSKAPSSKAMQV